MDKRYIDYADGSAADSQIILTADPGTGSLGKIPLSSLPGRTQLQTLFADATPHTTTGTSEEDFYSYTLPANTVNTNNQRLELFFCGTGSPFGSARIFGMSFGPGHFDISTTAFAQPFFMKVIIIRVDATHASIFLETQYGTAQVTRSASNSISFDWTSNQDFYCYLHSASAGDITGLFASYTLYE